LVDLEAAKRAPKIAFTLVDGTDGWREIGGMKL
jgi:hypothetical protein